MDNLLSIKWNNHQATFINSLSCLRKQLHYADAIIACEGKFYRAHKLVLSTCSDYFRDMFNWTDSSCRNPIILSKDVKCQIFEALLDFMYLGEVNIWNGDFNSFLEAAKCLKIKGLGVPDNEPHKCKKNGANESQCTREYISSSPPAKRKRLDAVEENQGSKAFNAHTSTPTKTTVVRSPESSLFQQYSVVETVDNTVHNNQGSQSIDLSAPVLSREMKDARCKRKICDLFRDGTFNIKGRDDGATPGAKKVESGGYKSKNLSTFRQQNAPNTPRGNSFGNSSSGGSSSLKQVERRKGWQVDCSNSSPPRLKMDLPKGCSDQNSMVIQATTGTSISPSSNSQMRHGRRSMKSGAFKIGTGFNCNVCDKWFPNKYQVERHEMTHTGKRRHRCPLCSKDYALKEHLKRHFIKIHGACLLPALGN